MGPSVPVATRDCRRSQAVLASLKRYQGVAEVLCKGIQALT